MCAIMEFAGYIKIYSVDPLDNIKPYYDEKEWRYLPRFNDNDLYCNRLIQNFNHKEIETLNEYMEKHYPLKFNLDDVS